MIRPAELPRLHNLQQAPLHKTSQHIAMHINMQIQTIAYTQYCIHTVLRTYTMVSVEQACLWTAPSGTGCWPNRRYMRSYRAHILRIMCPDCICAFSCPNRSLCSCPLSSVRKRTGKCAGISDLGSTPVTGTSAVACGYISRECVSERDKGSVEHD